MVLIRQMDGQCGLGSCMDAVVQVEISVGELFSLNDGHVALIIVQCRRVAFICDCWAL